ncbi:hypothetical protein [Paraburkholderia sp. BL10I2N1]|uniref:hypothetical protein n=1 Tax=Paraburkholderia sp. BL10I2N1 TaxID=1938796 RepID=UPI001061E489|nr:hypothetical protein [Paraburkholderia sp. BL10I2N1]TDN68783.1 hypothetical protein B0G77_2128 [Paraburkholderia sp. BL10I2N1]
MAKKKDFGIGGPVPARVIPIVSVPAETQECNARVTIPLPNGRVVAADFSEHLGRGFDDTVSAITQVLLAMVSTRKPEPLSLQTIVNSGLVNWWKFCSERATQGEPPTLLAIDASTIEAYVSWLTTRLKPNGEVWSKNTARTTYAKTKTVLEALVERKLLPSHGLFPPNPFPGATAPHNRRAYIRPLSDAEREHILRPLSLEVAQVFDGTHSGGEMTRLALCVFAILMKTGVNPTPLLELPRDLKLCFIDHPRVNRKVLVTFKRRADAYTQTPLEPSETKVVSLDVYKLSQRVVVMTEPVALEAIDTPLEGYLWLYRQLDGTLRCLSTQELSIVAKAFTDRHRLRRDDGTRLKMSSQLFRNTKINRVWRASKGDILATAKSGSNTPRTAERYLTVTPDMLEEHRLAGEVLVETLSGNVPREATPHSGCKDSISGELAPKNGEPCVDFLSCFRCKSQVIVQDDLYKLFSFYWALFAQRSHVGSDNWKKLFGWIVRIIDRDIAPKFDAATVAREKARARSEPHPMWRSPSVLAALRSVL